MRDARNIIFGIVEDDKDYSNYLSNLLYELPHTKKVFEFESAESALRFLSNSKRKTNLNFLIMDFKLPKMDGIQFLGKEKIKKLNIPKLILTGFDAEEKIFEALKFGATGYIFKEELSSIGSIVEILAGGGAHISPTIAMRVVNYFQNQDLSNQKWKVLTQKEKEILNKISEGYTVKEISEIFHITIFTTRTHIRNIYKKLEINNKTQLAKIFKR